MYKAKVLIITLCISTLSLACIGTNIRIAILGTGPETVIQRNIQGETKEELLDDTGYIGAHVLIADILNKSKEENINSQDFKNQIFALKERLSVLIRTLNSALDLPTCKTTKKDMCNNIYKSVQTAKRLKGILSDDPSRSEIESLWKSIESRVNSSADKNTNIITAKFRKAETKDWSLKEEFLTSFTLPVVSSVKNLTRSVCSNENLELNISNGLLRSQGATQSPGNGQGSSESQIAE